MPAEWRYRVTVARLPGDLPAIHEVRHQVFIVEQGIPAHLEWDGQDAACHHVLATDPRQAVIGTGRLDPRGRIGRMAVLPYWRSHGVGGDLLAALLALARAQGHREVVLHAQCAVAGFYRKAGFREQGQPFIEAGIEHLTMVKTLICGNNENNR
ncbi:MAG: GNAT family N-acetyltransferase [Gammaproteobacteria bacterium]